MTPLELYQWRKARGLTMAAAAQLLRVSPRWYAAAEAGRNSQGKEWDTIPARIELAIRKMEDEWQPDDRVRYEDEPFLCGTITRPPPDKRLRKVGWVWVLWDTGELEHCPAVRLLAV